jgi:hypothetical protein
VLLSLRPYRQGGALKGVSLPCLAAWHCFMSRVQDLLSNSHEVALPVCTHFSIRCAEAAVVLSEGTSSHVCTRGTGVTFRNLAPSCEVTLREVLQNGVFRMFGPKRNNNVEIVDNYY